jgi:hypothetical protein
MTRIEPGQKGQSSPLSWLVFAGFGLFFILYGFYALTLPSLQPTHWNFLTSDPQTIDYIASNFRWMGLISIGFGILTIGLSITGFRRGEKRAWFALLYYPVFFLLAIPFTWPGLAWIPFLVLALIALVLPVGAVFLSPPTTRTDAKG